MWALFDFVCSGELLGPYAEFRTQYEGAIIQSSDREATLDERQLGDAQARALRELIEPYFLRREKSVIFAEDSKMLTAQIDEEEKDQDLLQIDRKSVV